MTVEIEHGLPPPKKSGRPMDEGYQSLRLLGRGDSIFLPGKRLSSVRSYVTGLRFADLRKRGYKFRFAEATKDGFAGVRVWRVDGL